MWWVGSKGRLRAGLTLVAALGFAVAAGCSALDSVASQGVDFAGAKADAYCDRRFVTDGGQAAAFCQEIVATVAAAQFTDDCRTNHRAMAGAGLCPREHIIAGCKILEKHDDGSVATDWYYDVSDLVADAGANAGPDGGPTFDSRQFSVPQVQTTCASPTRYELGADLVMP